MNGVTIMNILVIVILIGFLYSGYKEGFLRKLLGILSFFVVGFFCWYASGLLAKWITMYPHKNIDLLDQLLYDSLNRITLFFILFILLQMVVLVLRPITKLGNHVPVVSLFNRIAGSILGIIQALLILFLISMGLRLPLWDKGNELVTASYLRYSDAFTNQLLFYTKEPIEELQKVNAALTRSEALTKEEAARLQEWLLDKNMKKEDADKILSMLRIE